MRNFIIILLFFSFTFIFSQERQKIDGVAAVIGDFVVLESDIEKQFTQLRVSGVSMENLMKAQTGKPRFSPPTMGLIILSRLLITINFRGLDVQTRSSSWSH